MSLFISVSFSNLKQQMVIRSYAADEISLGTAAELMGVSHEEMKDILAEELEQEELPC